MFDCIVNQVLFLCTQKKIYKDQMEFMLQNHVFPLFRSELGYMRARVSDRFQTDSFQILYSHPPVLLFRSFSATLIAFCLYTGLLGAALLL